MRSSDRFAVRSSGLTAGVRSLFAALAFAVQVIAGAIVKLSAKTNVIAGWGVGAVIRFLVLAVYALVFVKALGLPSTAALVSLAAFFFVSTLLEPLLLKS